MKISEVRNVIGKYSEDQLRVIITQLYRAIPKAIKEKNDIDGCIIHSIGRVSEGPQSYGYKGNR